MRKTKNTREKNTSWRHAASHFIDFCHPVIESELNVMTHRKDRYTGYEKSESSEVRGAKDVHAVRFEPCGRLFLCFLIHCRHWGWPHFCSVLEIIYNIWNTYDMLVRFLHCDLYYIKIVLFNPYNPNAIKFIASDSFVRIFSLSLSLRGIHTYYAWSSTLNIEIQQHSNASNRCYESADILFNSTTPDKYVTGGSHPHILICTHNCG